MIVRRIRQTHSKANVGEKTKNWLSTLGKNKKGDKAYQTLYLLRCYGAY